MGLMNKGREARAEKAGNAARDAWESGQLAYVHFQQHIGPTGESGMSQQVSEILDVGWVLAGTALSQSGSFQQAMFTFVRP